MPKVFVSINELAIIVPAKTGVVYYNQVAGCACLQRQVEGFVLPFDRKPTIRDYFFIPEWWYNCYSLEEGKLNPTWGDEPDNKYFRKWNSWYGVKSGIEHYFQELKLRINTKKPLLEAWFHVTIQRNFTFGVRGWGLSTAEPEIKKFNREKPKRIEAILTWENCD